MPRATTCPSIATALFTRYAFAIFVPFQVPAVIVPTDFTLVLPVQVDRAVFSTLPNPISVFVTVTSAERACPLTFLVVVTGDKLPVW